MIQEMEKERNDKIAIVQKLVHGDLRDIDNRMFTQFKADEMLMEEFAKEVLEIFYPNDKNSEIALEMKDILKKCDKELF